MGLLVMPTAALSVAACRSGWSMARCKAMGWGIDRDARAGPLCFEFAGRGELVAGLSADRAGADRAGRFVAGDLAPGLALVGSIADAHGAWPRGPGAQSRHAGGVGCPHRRSARGRWFASFSRAAEETVLPRHAGWCATATGVTGGRLSALRTRAATLSAVSQDKRASRSRSAKAAEALGDDCARADILISAAPVTSCAGPRLVLGAREIAGGGGYAVSLAPLARKVSMRRAVKDPGS